MIINSNIGGGDSTTIDSGDGTLLKNGELQYWLSGVPLYDSGGYGLQMPNYYMARGGSFVYKGMIFNVMGKSNSDPNKNPFTFYTFLNGRWNSSFIPQFSSTHDSYPPTYIYADSIGGVIIACAALGTNYLNIKIWKEGDNAWTAITPSKIGYVGVGGFRIVKFNSQYHFLTINSNGNLYHCSYNLSTNTWTSYNGVTLSASSSTGLIGAIGYNNKLYILWGAGTFYEFNPSNNTYTALATCTRTYDYNNIGTPKSNLYLDIDPNSGTDIIALVQSYNGSAYTAGYNRTNNSWTNLAHAYYSS